MSSPSIDIVDFVLLVCLDFASLCARCIAGASSCGRGQGAAMEMASIVGLDKTTSLRRSWTSSGTLDASGEN